MSTSPEQENQHKNLQTKQDQSLQALSAVSTNIAVSNQERPKSKKMSSNRRKKQKQKQRQMQARHALEQIIKDIYCLRTTYEQDYQTINDLLNADLDEDRFYEFINKVIREEVDELAEEIHSRTANFCELYTQDQAINPIEIAELYQLVETVKQASIQVQKIINLFVLKVQQVQDQQYLHHNLQLSTLRYIIQSDPYKEDFESFCLTFIAGSKDKRQKNIIQGILQTMKTALEYVDHTQQNEDLQCYEEQETQESKNKKKKKRNKKKGDEKKKQMNLYKEIQAANNVIENLSKLIIKQQDRKKCYIDQQWIMKLHQKYKTNRTKIQQQ